MKFTSIVTLFCAAAMAGCGGGGGSDETASTNAQGLWVGTTTDGRVMTAMVLSDGQFYAIYSPTDGSASSISGAVQGVGTTSGATFTVTDARDFSIEGGDIYTATVTASFSQKIRFDGVIRYADGSSGNFSTVYDRDYETKATIAAIEGYFDGKVASSGGVSGAYLNIDGNGRLSAYSYDGCSASGTVVPRSDANVYDVTVTFGSSPCDHPMETYRGIAYLRATTRSLLVAMPNASRTDGALFAGIKL